MRDIHAQVMASFDLEPHVLYLIAEAKREFLRRRLA